MSAIDRHRYAVLTLCGGVRQVDGHLCAKLSCEQAVNKVIDAISIILNIFLVISLRLIYNFAAKINKKSRLAKTFQRTGYFIQ